MLPPTPIMMITMHSHLIPPVLKTSHTQVWPSSLGHTQLWNTVFEYVSVICVFSKATAYLCILKLTGSYLSMECVWPFENGWSEMRMCFIQHNYYNHFFKHTNEDLLPVIRYIDGCLVYWRYVNVNLSVLKEIRIWNKRSWNVSFTYPIFYFLW